MLEDYTNLILENSAKTIYPESQNETNFHPIRQVNRNALQY